MNTCIYDLLIDGRKFGRLFYTTISTSRAVADILFVNAGNVRFDNKPAKVMDELRQYLTGKTEGHILTFRKANAEPVQGFEKTFRKWCPQEANPESAHHESHR